MPRIEDAPLTPRQAAVKRAADSAPVIDPGSDQALELQSLFAGLPEFVRERRAAEEQQDGREAA